MFLSIIYNLPLDLNCNYQIEVGTSRLEQNRIQPRVQILPSRERVGAVLTKASNLKLFTLFCLCVSLYFSECSFMKLTLKKPDNQTFHSVRTLFLTKALCLSAVGTGTPWPMQLRSRGCSMPPWRRTSSLAAPLISRGKYPPPCKNTWHLLLKKVFWHLLEEVCRFCKISINAC